MSTTTYYQRGAITPSVVAIVGLSIFTVAFAGLAIWAFVEYMDQKNNVDSKISSAVATAEKNLGDKLAADFQQAEKEPLKSFAGPADYGTLGFRYPKTWSVYVSNDGAKGNGYEAFLSPGVVPPVTSANSRYALHVTILDDSYESVLADYRSLVEKGSLKSSVVKVDEQSGTRLDGNFSKNIRGAAVIYKIRDKTAILQTDADTFKPDFDALIQTITFED